MRLLCFIWLPQGLGSSLQLVRALVLLGGIALLQFQNEWGAAQLVAQSQSSTDNFAPQPYDKDEFPLFLQDLRRFEVVLLGSIPITLLLSSLIYDIIYSIADPEIQSLQIAGSTEDIFKKIGISISISGLLAVIDMGIHLGHRNKKRKKRERALRESEFIGRTNSEQSRTGSDQTPAETKESAKKQQGPAGTAAPQGN